jgi:hypothetical protein
MKKMLLLFFAIGLLTACGGEKEDDSAGAGDEKESKATAEEGPKSDFESWEVFTMLQENNMDAKPVVEQLQGRKVTVRNLLVKREMEYWGLEVAAYNPGKEVSLNAELAYSGYGNYINVGSERFQYEQRKGDYFAVHLGDKMDNNIFDKREEVMDHDMKKSEMIYHDLISIEADSIYFGEGDKVVFANVKIIDHQNL